MKFKAPGRSKKRNKSSEKLAADKLAATEAAAAAAAAAEAGNPPVEEEPAKEQVQEDPTSAEEASVDPIPEEPVSDEPVVEEPADPVPEEPVPEEPVPEDPVPEEPERESEKTPAPEEQPADPEKTPEPPVPEETPSLEDSVDAAIPVIAVDDNFVNGYEEDDYSEDVSVELPVIAPIYGILRKGPYIATNVSPKLSKTLRKQRWRSTFCRIDPALMQIFCCDKDKSKLYESEAPVETDGKCMFFHFNHYTTVTEGIEEDPKAKEFTFKIKGLNGSPENYLTMSVNSAELREKWVKIIRRSVNRLHIDRDRVGDHTKLRQMLTSQEAEISILEEELEKMAVVAGECSGRASLAEEKLSLKEAECADTHSKLEMANLEIHSLKSQLAIMEERTRNLTLLTDDVTGVTAEEVEAAREQMQRERAERLRAIQLELGSEEDYLERYKKYLNLKRDSILQKHGSQFSLTSLGQPKMSPSTANAPLSLN